MDQGVEHLLCKHEALSSNPNLIKKKKKCHLKKYSVAKFPPNPILLNGDGV
jgi:hypothetical protein